MRIYLDMCCYNRPYDPQDQLLISMETQSKLLIQQWIEEGKCELIGSYTLAYECSNIPNVIRKKSILDFIGNNTTGYVGQERKDEVSQIAEKIMETNIKEYDAFHIASAIYAGCEFFITVDKRLLKYKTDRIKIVTPIEFVADMEEK